MPDEDGLPTREEIASLPRTARVAFAARCARRVLPLYTELFEEATAEQKQAVTQAVEMAEFWSANAEPDRPPRNVLLHAAHTSRAVFTANSFFAFADAVFAAAAAADAADAAATNHATATYAAAATYNAAAAAKAVAARAGVIRAMWTDFALLTEASGFWTDETPVPPAFFGPLWPEGVPEGWPAENADDLSMELEIEVPDDATDEEVKAKVREVLSHADGLYRARGYGGLKVDDLEVLEEVSEETEADETDVDLTPDTGVELTAKGGAA